MSFAESFWTQDYHSGFRILFDQLHEGVAENDEFVQLFTKRMELETYNGNYLKSIEDTLVANNKRYSNEDYVSSSKNAFKQLNENFAIQGEQHLQIASDINSLIIKPFSTWADEHKQRIKYSESIVFGKYKEFQNKRTTLEKLQKRYFNKCRLLEEFKSHYSDEEIDIEQLEDEETAELHDQIFNLGKVEYDYDQLKSLLTSILTSIQVSAYKVPILGTYNNCSSGSSITQWLLDNVSELNNNIISAEDFAQGLIDNEFIKLIGTMNNKTFINSSKYHYQWRPLVFEMTKLKYESGNQISDYFEDVKQSIGVNTVNFNDKSQMAKLASEINSLDNQYFGKVIELDKLRCEFEELVFDHLTFMEKCELDRLKAIKKVIYDFSSNFLKNYGLINTNLRNLKILEETIHPHNDLKFLIENFQTGKFNPQVVLYDNYYNSSINQNFGIELNTKSRLEKRVVPGLIQCILLNLDKIYPNLTSDEERIALWINPVNLSKVHGLRFELNNLDDLKKVDELISRAEPILVASILKLYLYELPDSVISNSLFDLIKSLYQINSNDLESRLTGLKNILANLPKSNLATLDSILTHLMRLIKIISKKDANLAEEFKNKLFKELSNLILRPKSTRESENDKNTTNYDYKLIDKLQLSLLNDLFEHKNLIFDDLRRRNSRPKGAELDEKPKPAKSIKVKDREKISEGQDETSISESSSSSNSLKRSGSYNKKKLSSPIYESNDRSATSSTSSFKSGASKVVTKEASNKKGDSDSNKSSLKVSSKKSSEKKLKEKDVIIVD